MTQARATVYSDAFKEALVRIACTPGRTVDVDGEVKALDLRVETDGAERACPVHHEGAVQGTMRIREVAKLYRTDSHWEVVVEIDAVVGVSAAAMENLRTSVRDIAKQVRDLPKGDWTLPAQPQPQPRDTATDCVASCSRDRFARPDATCASNCWNAYTPASSSNDDHTLEIVGGIILVVGVVTAVVAPIIWVWNECANHRCNGPK